VKDQDVIFISRKGR